MVNGEYKQTYNCGAPPCKHKSGKETNSIKFVYLGSRYMLVNGYWVWVRYHQHFSAL